MAQILPVGKTTLVYSLLGTEVMSILQNPKVLWEQAGHNRPCCYLPDSQNHIAFMCRRTHGVSRFCCDEGQGQAEVSFGRDSSPQPGWGTHGTIPQNPLTACLGSRWSSAEQMHDNWWRTMISFICLLTREVGNFSDHQQNNQVQHGSLLWSCVSVALPRFILHFLPLLYSHFGWGLKVTSPLLKLEPSPSAGGSEPSCLLPAPGQCWDVERALFLLHHS